MLELKRNEAGNSVRNMKKALTSYNIFFQLERERIIDSLSAGTGMEVDPIAELDKKVIEKKCFEIIKNYREIKEKKKRRHRKTHGKISFLDLSRAVAAKWKNSNPSIKAIFEKYAKLDKMAYIEEARQWSDQMQYNSKIDPYQHSDFQNNITGKQEKEKATSKFQDSIHLMIQKNNQFTGDTFNVLSQVSPFPLHSLNSEASLKRSRSCYDNEDLYVGLEFTTCSKSYGEGHEKPKQQNLHKKICERNVKRGGQEEVSEQHILMETHRKLNLLDFPCFQTYSCLMNELYQELYEIVEDKDDLDDFLVKLASIE